MMIQYLTPNERERYSRFHGMQHVLAPARPQTQEERRRAQNADHFLSSVSGGNGPDQRLTAVGRCIYCSATDDLTDEHIVPQGLGGNIVLPKSSCLTCARITGAIEQRILRGLLGASRTTLGIKGKKRKGKQTLFPITFVDELGSQVVENVDIKLYPTIMHLPILAAPRVIRKNRLPLPGFCGIWAKSLVDLHPFKREKEISFNSPLIDTLAFCQFLAKIAHGYAIAEAGKLIKPCLPDFIIRPFEKVEAYRGCYEYVGGIPMVFPQEPMIHKFDLGLHTETGRKYVVVDIRFFAVLGAPTYSVVAGELAAGVTVEQFAAEVNAPS